MRGKSIEPKPTPAAGASAPDENSLDALRARVLFLRQRIDTDQQELRQRTQQFEGQAIGLLKEHAERVAVEAKRG